MLATTSRDAFRGRWWISIEGLRVRYGTWSPSWGPADSGANRPVKPWIVDVPSISAQKAEPLNGDTRGVTASVELLDVGDALTSLFAVHNRSGMARSLLAEEVDATQTEIDVVDGSVFAQDTDLYLDRETIRCTGIAGNTLTVTRGMYGSQAVAHSQYNPNLATSRNCEVMDRPQFLHTRELVIYCGTYDLLEADCYAWRGIIDGVNEQDGVWSISASGNLARLKAKIGEKRAHGVLLDQLAGKYFGHGSCEDDIIEGQSNWNNAAHESYRTRGRSIWLGAYEDLNFPTATTTTRRLVLIEEELLAYEGNHPVTGSLLLDGNIDPNADTYMNNIMTPPRGRGMFADLIFQMDFGISREWSEDGNIWVYRNPLIAPHAAGVEVVHCLWHEDFTAGTDPVSVTLQLLLSGNGTGGTYDTLPDGWGLGLPEAVVDITAMENLKPLVAGVDLKFAIVDPTSCYDWLKEQVWRPAMLFPVESLDGKISLCRLYSRHEASAIGATVTLDNSKILAGTDPRMTFGKPPIGEMTIKINWDPGADEYWSWVKVTFGNSAEFYKGATQTIEIKCQSAYAAGATGQIAGGTADLGNVPPVLAGLIATVFDRYALQPSPQIECEVPFNLWPLVEVGAIVRLTSTTLPNVKTGARGITAEYCQVMEVKPNTRKSCLNLRLMYIGVHDAESRRIAPSAKVKSYTADFGPSQKVKLEIYRHEFTSSASSREDLDEFAAGDMVRFYDATCCPKNAKIESALEILSIDTSGATYDVVMLDINKLTYPPADGDFMEISDYDQQAHAQQDKFASQVGTDGTLGAGSATGHVRE